MTTINQADKLYLGSAAVDAIYLAGQKVWPTGPSQLVDNFNRADDPTGLGPLWVQRHGALAIVNNSVRVVGAASWGQYTYVTPMTGDDMEASITLGPPVGTTDHIMIFIGANAAGECLFFYHYLGRSYFWQQTVWSSYGNLSVVDMASFVQGDTITMRRVGDRYLILKNGVYTGYDYSTTLIPRDINHRLVGFGIYSDAGDSYRLIDSFSAKTL